MCDYRSVNVFEYEVLAKEKIKIQSFRYGFYVMPMASLHHCKVKKIVPEDGPYFLIILDFTSSGNLLLSLLFCKSLLSHVVAFFPFFFFYRGGEVIPLRPYKK